jgi:hypothetical protein
MHADEQPVLEQLPAELARELQEEVGDTAADEDEGRPVEILEEYSNFTPDSEGNRAGGWQPGL